MMAEPGLARSSDASSARGRRAAPTNRVAGKSLLAVSAAGTIATLLSLCEGRVVGGMAILLLTLLILEIMFHRALAAFHTTRTKPYPALSVMRQESASGG
jgi:hypothetical protein